MSTCSNPKCQADLRNGQKVCPECGTPVKTQTTERQRAPELETMILQDLSRRLPPGGNLPKKSGGDGPLTRPQMLILLVFAAAMFLVGFIPAGSRSEIESIESLSPAAIEMVTDESQTLSFEISPEGFDTDDIGVMLSNADVAEIEKLSMTEGEDNCELSVEIKAISPGETALTVDAADGDAASDPVMITVSKKIAVESISAFSPDSLSLETGETASAQSTLTTAGLTQDDLSISSSDENVVRIDSIELTDQDENSVLTLGLTAVAAGSADVKVSSIEDASISRTLSVTVSDPETEEEATEQTASGTSSGGSSSSTSDTSSSGALAGYTAEELEMTVYINKTGDCYHYDPECASRTNPITTTLGQALRRGKRACSKCVY